MNATSAGSKNLVHILSSPVIVTAHGKQAEVTSGEQVPISSSTTSTPVSGATSGFATTGTTSYQKIAIDLKVTPLIGDNGDVQLTIDQKVDDILGQQVLNGNSTPIISDREANSYVTVKSGDMIVLGGLQRTSKSVNRNKLGLLYEIPILSQLLGGNVTTLSRTELLFFIRPTIITAANASPDANKRIQELSNHEDIQKFLADPTPQSNSKIKDVIDRFKSN
jgi:general secretion pathway protein D